MRVWLASGSPRRRELLGLAGVDVDVRPSNADESRVPGTPPPAHALELARRKAATAPADRVVVAADTVVHRGDAIYEKPVDREEARATLRALSGEVHEVTTGVVVRQGAREHAFTVSTTVRFRALTDDEIERYLQTGEADDKAGAYGIQGAAAAFVAEVHGSWTNVVGLPLEETLRALRDLS
ncbi:MAG: septum formation protein Maf [Alphaproteobacteria bacterium]|nr:septum formation protein Maf [Alphaproteobacteria bacterium]MCB9697680.1 septum formation protein Maf [Alphaproteobacteria bacterium]